MTGVALLAHGAGSCPATVLRLLGPAVPAGVEALAVEARGSVDDVVGRIEDAARGRDVVLAAGVSLGAHAVALWSLAGGASAALLLAMPAWSGPPGPVASLTAATADAVEARGRAAVLAEVAGLAPGDWVVEELRAGWAEYDDDALVAALRAAAGSRAPTPDDLRLLTSPTAVVALADDPLHPEAVARSWAEAVPGAGLAVVARQAPARERGAMGRAGRALLDGLSGSR